MQLTEHRLNFLLDEVVDDVFCFILGCSLIVLWICHWLRSAESDQGQGHATLKLILLIVGGPMLPLAIF